MDLFTYLLGKKGQNTQKDLFSYLLGKKSSTSGIYATYTGQTFNITNTVRAKIKNWILGGNTEQTSEPTPDNPQEIHVVKGNNNINISNKNILNINRTLGEPSDTSFPNTTKRLFNYNEFVLGLTLNNYYAPERITNYSVNGNSVTLTTNSNSYGLGMVVKVKGNTKYSLSYETNVSTDFSSRIAFYEEDGSCLINSGVASTSTNNYLNFTTPATASFAVIIFSPSANISTTYKNIQLEEGDTITKFVPYSSINYPINLPIENLFDVSLLPITKNGVTLSIDNNGNLVLNGTPDITSGYINFIPSPNVTLKPNTYTISMNEIKNGIGIYFGNIGASQINMGDLIKERTFTINQTESGTFGINVRYNIGTLTNYILNAQLEEGTTANSYNKFGTPALELCKIGDYQDEIYYDSGEWYLKKNISKVVLNGTESWQDRPDYSSCDRFVLNYGEIPIQTVNGFSNLFLVSHTVTSSYPILITNNGMQIVINYSEKGTTSLEQFINWVSANNIIVYYVLANPTYTVITDTNLINQLNALLNSRSYNDLTNIEQTNEDLPFNISLDIITDLYQKLEYIEATGTQYIDTGLKGSLNTEIIATATKANDTSSQLFGDITTQSSAISCNVSLTNELTSRFGDKTTSINFGNYITQNTKFKIKVNKTGIFIGSQQIGTFNATEDFTTTNNILIFTRNGTTISAYWSGKIYSFQIYNNENMVRNFIPCIRKSDNEVGLYDTVEGQFYVNAGEGTFLTPNSQLIGIQSLNINLLSNKNKTQEIKQNEETE